jgi:hypothetical protein
MSLDDRMSKVKSFLPKTEEKRKIKMKVLFIWASKIEKNKINLNCFKIITSIYLICVYAKNDIDVRKIYTCYSN